MTRGELLFLGKWLAIGAVLGALVYPRRDEWGGRGMDRFNFIGCWSLFWPGLLAWMAVRALWHAYRGGKF
jgi:hypothetical protein